VREDESRGEEIIQVKKKRELLKIFGIEGYEVDLD